MDAQLKKKWIDALRSGEYPQARGALTDGEGFCCLGVLCKISGVMIEGNNCLEDGEIVGYLPVHKLTGLHSDLYEVWERNDGMGSNAPHSFQEMADYIEANIPADGVSHSGADRNAGDQRS
jgi:hypothetical protein